jgi:hypothetical protein
VLPLVSGDALEGGGENDYSGGARAASAPALQEKSVLELLLAAASPNQPLEDSAPKHMDLFSIIMGFVCDEYGHGHELLCLRLVCTLFRSLFSIRRAGGVFSLAQEQAWRERADGARFARLTGRLPQLHGNWVTVLELIEERGFGRQLRFLTRARLLPPCVVATDAHLASLADVFEKECRKNKWSLLLEFCHVHLRPAVITAIASGVAIASAAAVASGAPEIAVEEVHMDTCYKLSSSEVRDAQVWSAWLLYWPQ